jgi:hypothetical protein
MTIGSASTVNLDKAEEFMWLNARLVDRLRFDYHFRGGDAARVVGALRPYQNDDGGFGNAFEPDLRGPGSQPCTVDLALGVLDDVGAMETDMVPDVIDYLASIARPDGGIPFVLPTVVNTPRAPWWVLEEGPPGALNPTGGILGRLHKNGIRHEWIDRGTQFCWHRLDALTSTTSYEVGSILTFLAHVPDRPRAEAAWGRVATMILDGKLAELDPDADGEVHSPLAFAPTPHSLARQLFDDDVITKHLDATEAAQQADGGWRFNFQSWTPITEPEWRGWVTLETLITLRAYGRLR